MKRTWRNLPLSEVVSMRPGNNKIIKGKQSDRPGPGLFQAFSASGPDVWVSSAEYNQPGIVISAVGARCGKTFIAQGRWSAIANTHVLLPGEDIDPRWLWYLTNDEAFWIRGGTAQPFVKVRETLQRPCMIPPLADQQQIVRLLDEAFERIAIAKANTEKNLQNARALFESQMQSLFTQSQTEWEKLLLTDVTEKITDGSHNPPSGVPASQFLMLSSKNVFDDALDYLSPRYLSAENFDIEHKRTGVIPGDVLLTIVGTIGRCAVVPNGVPHITLQRSVAVIRPDQARLASRFLMYSLMSTRAELNELGRGVAQKGIYLESLRNVSVAVPTLEEQLRIVGQLDLLQDHTNQLADNYAQKAKGLSRLVAALLHQAFSRRLAAA